MGKIFLELYFLGLCAQGSILVRLWGPYGVSRIKPGSTACKTSTLISVLSLQFLGKFFTTNIFALV